ncbi:hypothetical protein GOL96_32785 [Sinorhizobium medicae]|nr:hypothetical protein [Sinorhizobium medicae]MDX1238376.1 hypothetical protein [Sinorhizobium medicae]
MTPPDLKLPNDVEALKAVVLAMAAHFTKLGQRFQKVADKRGMHWNAPLN